MDLLKDLNLNVCVENKTTNAIVDEIISEIENRVDLSFKDKMFIYNKLITNSNKIKAIKKELTTSDLINILF